MQIRHCKTIDTCIYDKNSLKLSAELLLVLTAQLRVIPLYLCSNRSGHHFWHGGGLGGGVNFYIFF